MASTYLSLHYHLEFATKNRETLIAPEWRPRLHQYLGGTILGLGGVCESVGGVADHVHMLIGMKAAHCLTNVLRELKKASFTWVLMKSDCVPSPGRRATPRLPSA